jgi:hypothetical protein
MTDKNIDAKGILDSSLFQSSNKGQMNFRLSNLSNQDLQLDLGGELILIPIGENRSIGTGEARTLTFRSFKDGGQGDLLLALDLETPILLDRPEGRPKASEIERIAELIQG